MIAILGRGAPPDPTLAQRMLAAAPHRGHQSLTRTVGNCVLGIAAGTKWPDESLSAEGPLTVALSGTIDNVAQLTHEVTEAGVPPASPAAADLVAAAFGAFGPEAPARLRGCFAAVVTDGHRVWCFRDHIGFRPLFYHIGAGVFTAASEARQVVTGAQVREEPDLEVLEQIFYGRQPSDLPSALKGVQRLPQATVLTYARDAMPRLRRYWDPAALLETGQVRGADLRDRFAELMEQAVSRCLQGREAVLLSGGVDSPTVAAFAAQALQRDGGRRLGAVSAVFPDLPAVDERTYIEEVARAYAIDLHTYRPRARALDDVEAWCRRCGGPVPILSLPEIEQSHALTHRLGYRTVLTGDFAEFMVGDPTHVPTHLLTHLRLRALARVLAGEHRRGVPLLGVLRHFQYTFLPGEVAMRYLRWRRLDAPERIPDWLDAQHVNLLPFRGDLLPPIRERWRESQLFGTEGSTITLEADELCAVRSGVTVRRPFADIDLWEFFLSLPAEAKFPDLRYKTLLRTFVRGRIPDSILDRRRSTVFDDHIMAQIDYEMLERYLTRPRHHLPGVDYPRLATRLAQRDFTRFDLLWAQDLARIHAFLNAW